MSTLTPIGARLQIALDAEYLRMHNEWFFRWHHIGRDSVIEIDGFDGRMIRYSGIKFSGTARDVYWHTIQRYARQKVGQLFDELEIDLQKYPVEIRSKALNEVLPLILAFIGKIRNTAVDKDRILRGNGFTFPAAQDLGIWLGVQPFDIESRIATLRHIYCDLEVAKGGDGMVFKDLMRGKVTLVNSRVTFGTDNSINIVNQFQPSVVANLVEQIRSHVNSLPEPQRTEIAAPLKLLEDESKRGSPEPSKVKDALRSILAVAEGAAGNLIAAGIQAIITKMVGFPLA
ncbi:MAG: hypothetical protein KGR48_11650 [Alphaproteobacteria bacterium]|nr:hypothetical protein [Alphaproteobacteria bacterium]MDE2012635.1 hypothetical protein [Alphaproteobacteria bacterium]MDE2072116.1 hypothetical protein [Alphaproteobacteria bacterium]MDE2352426.1 hypothetical protein [Alphaproteobacteria bacterium]